MARESIASASTWQTRPPSLRSVCESLSIFGTGDGSGSRYGTSPQTAPSPSLSGSSRVHGVRSRAQEYLGLGRRRICASQHLVRGSVRFLGTAHEHLIGRVRTALLKHRRHIGKGSGSLV